MAFDGRLNGPFTVVCSSGDRDLWLQQRLTGIGASEISAVMGCNRYEAALHLYARKIRALGVGEDEIGEPAYWGSRLERLVADEFSIRTGLQHEWQGDLLRSTIYPWALCTLDGLVVAEGLPLECKTTTVYLEDDWADGTPHYYVLQCQQQMLVTGAARCYVACLIGGQRFVWDIVERDEALISQLIAAGTEFWRRVQEQDPPAPDGSDSAEQALRALTKERDEELEHRIELDAGLSNVAEALEQVKWQHKDASASVKELEAKRKQLQQTIRLAMGGAKYAELGGWLFIDEVKTRAGYTCAPATWNELQRTTLEDLTAKNTKKAKTAERKRAA
jgi:putative phage-type endonuclease